MRCSSAKRSRTAPVPWTGTEGSGSGTASALAPAKVNLALHVTGRRADGRHELDSLVVFADAGDILHAAPAPRLSLTVTGPCAAGVPTGGDNLVLRAARLLDPACGAALTLEKHLPVAAGIGGGSSDAAAALRLLAGLWARPLPDRDALMALGADLPVCLAGGPTRMQGAGERLEPVAGLPAFDAVLVNPGVPVSTGAVFSALTRRRNPPLDPLPEGAARADWLDWLRAQRNELQQVAIAIRPEIADALRALADAGAVLVRMSGSGATCFGLFADRTAARTAARAIADHRPAWWVRAVRLNSPASPTPRPAGGG